MTTSFNDLSQRTRESLNKLTLHLVAMPLEERERMLVQIEATAAEGYEVGDGMSPERSAAMARQWCCLLRSRLAICDAANWREQPNA